MASLGRVVVDALAQRARGGSKVPELADAHALRLRLFDFQRLRQAPSLFLFLQYDAGDLSYDSIVKWVEAHRPGGHVHDEL